jgi:hypothetical protein
MHRVGSRCRTKVYVHSDTALVAGSAEQLYKQVLPLNTEAGSSAVHYQDLISSSSGSIRINAFVNTLHMFLCEGLHAYIPVNTCRLIRITCYVYRYRYWWRSMGSRDSAHLL